MGDVTGYVNVTFSIDDQLRHIAEFRIWSVGICKVAGDGDVFAGVGELSSSGSDDEFGNNQVTVAAIIVV